MIRHRRKLQFWKTLISGSLSPAFSSWTQLEWLSVFDAPLEGTLSPGFGLAWRKIVILQLKNTQLSGTLDPALAGMRNLGLLDMSSTLLSGTLSPDFSAWRRLVRHHPAACCLC